MPVLIALAYISLFALALMDNFRGPFYPDILRDLQLGSTVGSLFFALASLMAVFGSLLSQAFLRRFSSLSLLGVSCFALALGFAAIGGSAQFPAFLAGVAVFGLGLGAINVAQNLLISEAAPAHRRRQLYNGLHAMYGMASLIAPLLVSFLRDRGVDWRQAFWGLALFPFLLALLSFRGRSPKPSRAQGQALPANKKLTRSQWQLAVLFSFVLGIYLWGELSLSTRLVLWLREAQGLSPDQADARLTAFFVCLLAGRVLFGFYRVGGLSNRSVLCFSSLLAGALYFLGVSGMPYLVLASGLAMAPFYPVMMDEVAHTFAEHTAQAMSVVISVSSITVVVMHVFVGFVNEHYGITLALQICAAAVFVLGLLLLLWRHRKSELQA